MPPSPSQPVKADKAQLLQLIEEFRALVAAIQEEVRKVMVGQEAVSSRVIMGLFVQGHILLEGVPGLGKTLLLNTLSKCLGLQFNRVQFTPDLMPADILGTRIFTQDKEKSGFVFERGPVFTNFLLADEINRGTPKTQSALLEAMQERQVTIAGTTHPLPRPFLVLATQNPIEMEGTYPLPEAQLDRFLFKLDVPFPDQFELVEIATRTTGRPSPEPRVVVQDAASLLKFMPLIRMVPVAEPLLGYCAKLILSTHPDSGPPTAKKYIRFGAGPRGMQALVLASKVRALLVGRTSVIRDDIIDVAQSCLQHRVILNFNAESEGVRPATVIELLLRQLR